MGSLPSSRLTRILQEKAELLKKRRQSAETIVKDAEERVKNLESIQITLPETKDRETQIRELMRRSDWEEVETRAKSLLEYIENSAAPALEARGKEIAERGERLRGAGTSLPPDAEELMKSLATPDAETAWGERVARLARLDAAIVETENAYSQKIRSVANQMVNWVDEPAERRVELEQKFRAAVEPIHRGQLAEAVEALDRTILSELPRVVERREASRKAGSALVAVARDLGIPSAELEAALTTDAETPPRGWYQSVGAVERESQRVADSMRERVLQNFESLRATLESIRDLGVDPTTNLARLAEISREVPDAGPATLPGLLGAARALVEEPVVSIVATLLDEVRPRLVEARRLGRDPSEVFAAMNRAREALQLRIYSEAVAASQEALESVGKLTSDLEAARAEAASLQSLLDRLMAAGFPATPYREPLARALQLLERVELEPARALLTESFRGLGQQAILHFTRELEELTKVSEIAQERGFLPGETRDALARARHHLEDGEIAEAGELLAQTEVQLRSAAGPFVSRRVEEIEKGFEEFPEKSLVAPVRLLLADADVNLRVKEDLAASLESLRKAEREFSAVFAAHASALVEGLEEERRNLEAMGGTGDEIQRQIDEVQQIFNMGDFVKASRASQEIRTRAHQQMLLRSEESVSHAKLALVELGKMGLEVPQLRTQFEEAQAKARDRQHIEAYQVATATEKAAGKLRQEAQGVVDALDHVAGLWQSLKQAGLSVDGYREALTRARQSYQALQFEPAIAGLAELTKQLEEERDAAETRRLLAESDLLAQDARRMSIPLEPLDAQLKTLETRSAPSGLAEALPEARALRQEFVRALRPVLEEHLRSLERDLEVAQSAGVEVPKVVEMLGEARRRLAAPIPGGAAERLDAARAELMETRGLVEHADRLAKRARTALSEAELTHTDTRVLRPRMDQLEALLTGRDYPKAIELAGSLEREIAQSTYQHVSKTLAGFQGSVVRARQEGSETTMAENLLRQARTALEAGRPMEALQLAARSESELERVELQLLVAQGSMKAIDLKVAEAEKEGVQAPGARPVIAGARTAFEAHRYSEVLERAIDASDLLADARSGFRRSREALDSAERQLQEVDRFGADTAEAVPVLQAARTLHAKGEYAESTERAREAAEKARWAIERVYSTGLAEVRGYIETGRKAGLTEEIEPLDAPIDEVEDALRSRDWAKATGLLQRARDAACRVLDTAIDSRIAALPAVVEPAGSGSPLDREARDAALRRITELRERREYPGAFEAVAEEQARSMDRRRQELGQRVAELKDRIWVGEKLGVDTTPVMELLTEANQALESSDFPKVPEIVGRADRALSGIVGPRLADRQRELQTEVVFASEGLHVILGPIPDRLAEVDQLRAGGDPVGAARLFLAQEEELNQRKAMHRELLNIHYLIDAALTKAGELRLDASEGRKLLDESIRARATEYKEALEKARAALASLQALLRRSEGGGPAPLWPFRRPPGA